MKDANDIQRMRVLAIMADGEWRTLMELDALLGRKYLSTSISARLRDFRKQRYGGYRVERRQVGDSTRTFEYRVIPPERLQAGQVEMFGELA